MITHLTWSPLPFGRYEGKTLPQVVLRDADWFFWALGTRAFGNNLANQSKDIAYKAGHIKIPKPDPENWRINYVTDREGNFARFSIITAQDAFCGKYHGHSESYLDLSWPRIWKKYDKLGCSLMLRSFRYHYFGGLKLTKERCDAFFSDAANFVWSA